MDGAVDPGAVDALVVASASWERTRDKKAEGAGGRATQKGANWMQRCTPKKGPRQVTLFRIFGN